MDRWKPEHSMHMNTPRFHDAHRGSARRTRRLHGDCRVSCHRDPSLAAAFGRTLGAAVDADRVRRLGQHRVQDLLVLLVERLAGLAVRAGRHGRRGWQPPGLGKATARDEARASCRSPLHTPPQRPAASGPFARPRFGWRHRLANATHKGRRAFQPPRLLHASPSCIVHAVVAVSSALPQCRSPSSRVCGVRRLRRPLRPPPPAAALCSDVTQCGDVMSSTW